MILKFKIPQQVSDYVISIDYSSELHTKISKIGKSRNWNGGISPVFSPV